jgi:hypothetical protein
MNFDLGSVHQAIHPFAACTAPMSTIAAMVKALSSVVVVLTGGLAVARAIASGFGFSFSMGKGAGDGD